MTNREDGLPALTAALVAARHRACMTQRELSRRLGRAHSYIAKIERSQRRVSVIEFAQLARAFGIDPRDLLAEVLGLKRRDE